MQIRYADHGFHCPLTESLDTTECINREQKGWMLCACTKRYEPSQLRTLEGTCSLDDYYFLPITIYSKTCVREPPSRLTLNSG